MNNKTVSERLIYLRSINKKTQNRVCGIFRNASAFYVCIRKRKNNPTIDVLIDIADKCNVSLDWIAGRSDYTFGLSSMRDFVLFMNELAMKKEIGFKIIVEDKFANNNIETDKNNGMLSLCSMVMIKNTLLMLTYAIS